MKGEQFGQEGPEEKSNKKIAAVQRKEAEEEEEEERAANKKSSKQFVAVSRQDEGEWKVMKKEEQAEQQEDSEDAPEASQDPMLMKGTKMSVKGLPAESSHENHLTQTADWRNEYETSTEAPPP